MQNFGFSGLQIRWSQHLALLKSKILSLILEEFPMHRPWIRVG